MKKEASNAGRKTKYKDDFPERVEEMAREGMIEVDMARQLGVCVDTFNEYKKGHPEFLVALKQGKKVIDDKVVSALYQRASGYSHEDVHISNYQGDITITPIIKHYPPDPASMIFWLKNRRPDEWRDKSHLEHGGRIETEFSFGDDGRRIRALVKEALARISGNGKNKQWLPASIPE